MPLLSLCCYFILILGFRGTCLILHHILSKVNVLSLVSWLKSLRLFQFVMEDNCFRVRRWFLLCNNVNQPCVYIRLLPRESPRSSQSTRLSSLALRQCPTSPVLNTQQCARQCSSLSTSHSLLSPPCPQGLLCICMPIPALQMGSSVSFALSFIFSLNLFTHRFILAPIQATV